MMENLKVKVTTEQESKEVQELFVKLGAVDSVSGFKSAWVCLYKGQIFLYDFLPNIDFKEITIQELRGMAVAQQEQDEPFFTPECTLNDQYAEIEQVRQNQKTIDAMREAEGILGDKQLKWSQWDLQVGGDHYKSMKIQPAKFALENKLDYCQANAIKYICRHESKNGKQDLEKAKHYIDLLIEHYYGDQNAI